MAVLGLLVLGAACGVAAASLAAALSARLGPSPFWHSLPGILKTLAAGADSGQFGTAYAALLRGLLGHLARNLLVWGAPLLPLGLLCWWGAPAVHRHFARHATALAVASGPVDEVRLDSQPLQPLASGGYALPGPEAQAGSTALRVRQQETWVEFADWRLPNATTSSPWAAVGLPLLGVTLSPAPAQQVGTHLLRPEFPGAKGWGWPWISGPELAFYAGLTLGSLAVGLWGARAGQPARAA